MSPFRGRQRIEFEVRQFRESDRDELIDLFGRAGEGAPTASPWGHIASEADVYLTSYLDADPSSVFVAVADGRLTGYLVGALDASTMPSEDERIKQALRRHRVLLHRRSLPFFARALWDRALAAIRRQPTAGELHDPRYPSHLHINVAREVRGTGAAAALMQLWFHRLNQAGSAGCFLQTLVENDRAVQFFERMGFTPYGPTPAAPGLRYNGQRVHQQTMVQRAPFAESR